MLCHKQLCIYYWKLDGKSSVVDLLRRGGGGGSVCVFGGGKSKRWRWVMRKRTALEISALTKISGRGTYFSVYKEKWTFFNNIFDTCQADILPVDQTSYSLQNWWTREVGACNPYLAHLLVAFVVWVLCYAWQTDNIPSPPHYSCFHYRICIIFFLSFVVICFDLAFLPWNIVVCWKSAYSDTLLPNPNSPSPVGYCLALRNVRCTPAQLIYLAIHHYKVVLEENRHFLPLLNEMSLTQ